MQDNTAKIKQFFDQRAPHWDDGETCPETTKRSLLAAIGIRRGERVLDLACGTGVVTALLHEQSQAPVVGLDLSPNMIEIARRKYAQCDWATFVQADFITAQLDNPFDVVVIYNAYPHFLDVNQLCDKLYKTIAPQGKVGIVHSMSRQALAAHHSGAAGAISRDLDAPTIEAQRFAPYFTPLVAEESDLHYLLVMQKQ